MRVPSWAKNRWFLGAMAATLVMLSLGYMLKAPCLDVPWDGSQFEEMCYTDLPVIYSQRGLHEDQIPYVEAWNEYPVVSGMWQYGAALLSDSQHDFFLVNAIGFSILALVTTALLHTLVEDRRRVFLWAAGPPLLLYAFHNWDVISVFAAVAGYWSYRKGLWSVAGAWFALGASAKVWPGIFLVFLGLELLREDRRWNGRAVQFGAGATVMMLLLHVPFLIANFDLYLAGYAWHLERGPTFESFWLAARHWSAEWRIGWIETLVSEEVLPVFTKVLLLTGMVWLAGAVWMRRLSGLEATFGGVLLFLIMNQVFSVQYALWLLPFFVLLPRVSLTAALAFFLADLMVYLTIWPLFVAYGTGEWSAEYTRVSLATTFRHVVLLTFLVFVAGWASDGRWRASWERWKARISRTGPEKGVAADDTPTR